VRKTLDPITEAQMHVLARSPWVRALHAELRAAGLHNGYAEGICCSLSGHAAHRTMTIALGPVVYPRLVLDIKTENLPEHPPGYIAEFSLEQSGNTRIPLGPTRIGTAVEGIDAHFDKLMPSRFVQHLQGLLAPVEA
jgi:hypothetical protein